MRRKKRRRKVMEDKGYNQVEDEILHPDEEEGEDE